MRKKTAVKRSPAEIKRAQARADRAVWVMFSYRDLNEAAKRAIDSCLIALGAQTLEEFLAEPDSNREAQQ